MCAAVAKEGTCITGIIAATIVSIIVIAAPRLVAFTAEMLLVAALLAQSPFHAAIVFADAAVTMLLHIGSPTLIYWLRAGLLAALLIHTVLIRHPTSGKKDLYYSICISLPLSAASLALLALTYATYSIIAHSSMLASYAGAALQTLAALAAALILTSTCQNSTVLQVVPVYAASAAATHSLAPIPLLLGTVLQHDAPPPSTRRQSGSTGEILGIPVGVITASLRRASSPIQAIRHRKRLPRWLKHLHETLPKNTRWRWATEPGTLYTINVDHRTTPHILVVGATGSGKTTLVKELITGIASLHGNNRVIVIDPHGEYYTHCKGIFGDVFLLKAGSTSLNPLEPPPGIAPRLHASNLSFMLAALYRLGPLQQSLLYSALLSTYEEKGIDPDSAGNAREGDWPTLSDLRKTLREALKSSNRAANLLTYIDSFIAYFSPGKYVYNVSELIQKYPCIVVNLEDIPLPELRFLYVDTVLKTIYSLISRRHMRDNGDRIFLVIDEAHNFVSRGLPSPYLVKIFSESRKYRVVVIASTQQATKLHDEVLANTGHLLALHHVEPREATYIAHTLSGINDAERIKVIEYTLSMLPKGYVVTRRGNVGEVVILRTGVYSQRNKP